MKTINSLIITLLLAIYIVPASAQRKFEYKLLNGSSQGYIVSPIFKQPIDEVNKDNRLRGLRVYFNNPEELSLRQDSVIRSAITNEKWHALLQLAQAGNSARINFSFSPSGLFYSLRFALRPPHLEILTDDDLYAIYQVFLTYKEDMSLINMDFPENSRPLSDSYWSGTSRFPSKAYCEQMKNKEGTE